MDEWIGVYLRSSAVSFFGGRFLLHSGAMANEIKRVHFIGICGTGMATLAAMMKDSGFEVSGADDGVYPPMSDFLANKGINVSRGFSLENLKPEPDLVVVGNALSRGNPEIEYVLNFKIRYTSLPEALKEFFLRRKASVVVTGTHGKTTTTSMISWVLHSAGFEPDFFIGGIAENFQSSYRLGGGKHFVVEGDEYDSAFFDKGPKFMHYLPDLAVVGNVEFDHADIYPDLDSIRIQFQRFVNLIPERGFLAVGADSPAALEVSGKAFCRRETFGMSTENDWSAGRIVLDNERLCFDVLYQKKLFRRVNLALYGTFNIRNALAAIAVLHRLGVAEDDIREGLASFRGVRRRLQFRAEVGGVRIYEDFAHHPTAVRETLQAVREAFQPRRIWAIYEPRSATGRRNVFQSEIAEALALADCIALPSLYRPEKLPQGERLDIEMLVDDLRRLGRAAWNLASVEGIIQKVCSEAESGDLVLIMSNGGFGGIYEKLPAALAQR
jgi:UDP-N-acetylmuramate: L-alanyl-gamma-D-glutamyl-meso-diaminopimelate ligase